MMYFMIPNKEWYKVAFSDLYEKQKTIKWNKVYSGTTYLLNKLDRNETFPINFLKKILYMIYPFGLLVKKRNSCYLCFTDVVYKKTNRKYLQWLKKQFPSVQIILLLYNKIALLYDKPGNEQLHELPNDGRDLQLDYIFTYDLDEAGIFGFPYFEVYSRLDKLGNKEHKIYDIFYCGSVAHLWKMSRYEIVKEIYDYLGEEVLRDFHMVFENDAKGFECEFKRKKRLSYAEILKHDLASNVILEIVSDGKYGATFRYCEAVVYNIKLLTNNPNIVKYPFYNPRYMKLFSKVEDIDVEWIKKREKVDYHYNGEFSPKSFMDEFFRE